jgi:hypothetical protein
VVEGAYRGRGRVRAGGREYADDLVMRYAPVVLITAAWIALMVWLGYTWIGIAFAVVANAAIVLTFRGRRRMR